MIHFVAPLPPPVHGFSWVNQQILSLLRCEGSVRVFNRAPAGNFSSRFLSIGVGVFTAIWLFVSFVFWSLVRRPTSMYVGWSGGAGMVVDSLFVAFSRLLKIPVYVHHHSFAYLNIPSLASSVCGRQLRQCTNIVLCERMADLLEKVYGVPRRRILVLSNAAFLDLERPVEKKAIRGEFRVGFLSNISAEKGIFDFLDLAEKCYLSESSVQFVVAGPVAPSISDAFFDRVKQIPNVSHVGPVYGDDKRRFYSEISVLAFPTRYANEAEPVTVLEAFAASVPVIANHRGCISTMIDHTSGFGVAQAGDFVEVGAAHIAQWIRSEDEFERFRCGARVRFELLHKDSVLILKGLIKSLHGD